MTVEGETICLSINLAVSALRGWSSWEHNPETARDSLFVCSNQAWQGSATRGMDGSPNNQLHSSQCVLEPVCWPCIQRGNQVNPC